MEVNLNETKKGNLGFGFMRLPMKDGDFDYEQINRMVDTYLANGFAHFDTAYVYQGSEEAMRKTLVERHPREQYQIATKLNLMQAKSAEDMPKIFDTSLKRLGTDYVDFYLLHGIGLGGSIETAEAFGAWDFVQRLKSEGRVRHAGFSFHGTPESLEDILTKHPEAEFVQLQINYLDWDSEDVQSRKLYETARRHGKPVFVMEPVRGGMLASDQSAIAKLFKDADPKASLASWALRFAAELDGVYVVLSGMSSYAQLEDNIATMKNLKPLSQGDRALLQKAADTLRNIPRIPCTGCRYCVEGCPQKINIPMMMNCYSDYLVYSTTENVEHMYRMITSEGNTAATCIACGACEKTCPQSIKIIDTLANVAKLFD